MKKYKVTMSYKQLMDSSKTLCSVIELLYNLNEKNKYSNDIVTLSDLSTEINKSIKEGLNSLYGKGKY